MVGVQLQHVENLIGYPNFRQHQETVENPWFQGNVARWVILSEVSSQGMHFKDLLKDYLFLKVLLQWGYGAPDWD